MFVLWLSSRHHCLKLMIVFSQCCELCKKKKFACLSCCLSSNLCTVKSITRYISFLQNITSQVLVPSRTHLQNWNSTLQNIFVTWKSTLPTFVDILHLVYFVSGVRVAKCHRHFYFVKYYEVG